MTERRDLLFMTLTNHTDENTTQQSWLHFLHAHCHTVAVLQCKRHACVLSHGTFATKAGARVGMGAKRFEIIIVTAP